MITARPEGDDRSGTQMLLDAIVDGQLFIEGADSVLRVHELLKGAKAIARNKSALADDLLWFIWDNAVTSDGQKLVDGLAQPGVAARNSRSCCRSRSGCVDAVV
jgi:hypothetical protein